jgi:hypothetical protein
MTANFHKPIRQPPPFCLVTLKLSVHKTIGVSPLMNLFFSFLLKTQNTTLSEHFQH